VGGEKPADCVGGTNRRLGTMRSMVAAGGLIMRIPNGDRAIVDRRKIADYCL
jgi:hypothetical protein